MCPQAFVIVWFAPSHGENRGHMTFQDFVTLSRHPLEAVSVRKQYGYV